MLNPLKIATDGYLKRNTMEVLIIAVAGYLNFSSPSGITQYGGGRPPETKSMYAPEYETRIAQILKDDKEVVEVLKIFIQCL